MIHKHHNQIKNEKISNTDQKKKFNPELKALTNVSLKPIDGSETQKEKFRQSIDRQNLYYKFLKRCKNY